MGESRSEGESERGGGRGGWVERTDLGEGKITLGGPFLATNQLGVSYQTARLQDNKLPTCKTKIRLQDCRLQDYMTYIDCMLLVRLHIPHSLVTPKGPADLHGPGASWEGPKF